MDLAQLTGEKVTTVQSISSPRMSTSLSADPQTRSHIDSNYLLHLLDVKVQAGYVQVLDKLAKTEPLASYILPG